MLRTSFEYPSAFSGFHLKTVDGCGHRAHSKISSNTFDAIDGPAFDDVDNILISLESSNLKCLHARFIFKIGIGTVTVLLQIILRFELIVFRDTSQTIGDKMFLINFPRKIKEQFGIFCAEAPIHSSTPACLENFGNRVPLEQECKKIFKILMAALISLFQNVRMH